MSKIKKKKFKENDLVNGDFILWNRMLCVEENIPNYAKCMKIKTV